ncbi:hypothetical protein HNP81_003569 [Peribacillus huizhouensis]|uniref:Uncharacterized protein n=1 Tax=Peribacillus huizhouensis TaxID=1501239 RepID=A0ABR6CT84_9BACI|nr:hypothetical protein [Peribacillus huizhouensis]
MDMKDFIVFCKSGNPISGEDKELHVLLTQCSFEIQCEPFYTTIRPFNIHYLELFLSQINNVIMQLIQNMMTNSINFVIKLQFKCLHNRVMLEKRISII